MKVVLLLVAIYALIINQALKQVDSKDVIKEVKKARKINEPARYINASSIPVSPFAIESEIRPVSMESRHPVQPGSLLKQNISYPEIYKVNSALYPINYPYQSTSEKKRS
ncbi:MAG: hypothetical protein DI535_17055 [Citrobacter freundii]|nr:MAG: hypothetical protein DI535_17055 [Citrobacter freundii]